MTLFECLGYRIVLSNIQPHLSDLDTLSPHVLLVSLTCELRRQSSLDHENSVIIQMPRDILEATHLLVLSEQIEQRVEHDVDQPVRARYIHIGKITRA